MKRLVWVAFLIISLGGSPAYGQGMVITPANAAQLTALRVLVGHSGWVYDVAWHPNNADVVSVGQDGSVRVWHVSDGATVHLMNGHAGSVISAAWRPDGTVIASGGLDDMIFWWDASAGVQVGAPLQNHTGDIWEVAWNADASILASASEDATLSLWDGQTGAHLATNSGHTAAIYTMVWNGNFIATGDSAGLINIWENTTLMARLDAGFTVNSLAWWGNWLVAVGETDEVLIWDMTTQEIVGYWYIYSAAVYSTAFSPDGSLLAIGARDGLIYLLNTADGSLVHTLVGHTDLVSSVAFSTDGASLASASYDGTIHIWGLP